MMQLTAKRISKAVDRVLARAVCGLKRNGTVRERRSDLNDGATVPWQHASERGEGAVDESEIKDIRNALVVIGSHLLHGRKHADHRIVHPDVDRAEVLFD